MSLLADFDTEELRKRILRDQSGYDGTVILVIPSRELPRGRRRYVIGNLIGKRLWSRGRLTFVAFPVNAIIEEIRRGRVSLTENGIAFRDWGTLRKQQTRRRLAIDDLLDDLLGEDTRTKADKVRALANDPRTPPGERKAAQAALTRMRRAT